MDNFIEKCIAICAGAFATIVGIDLLILVIWIALIVLDIITGITRSKLLKQQIVSGKITDGVTRKLMPILLVSAFYLVTVVIDIASGIDFGVMPNIFASLYIIAEFKSIIENAQEANIFIPREFSNEIDRLFNTDIAGDKK